MESLFCGFCGTSWVPWCSQPPESIDVLVCVNALECGSDGFPGAVAANSRVLEAAKGQLNRPVFSPGTQVCCAVTNTRLHSAWQTVFFTALRRHSRSAETPVCRFDVFLSQVMLFLTTLSVAEEMWHHLLFVQSNSFVGGW